MQQHNAIGMIEYDTVTRGITASDAMIKAAQVGIIRSFTACPGKYIILLRGRLSSINASMEQGRLLFPEHVSDSFILGNPHPSIFEALEGQYQRENVEALGIIETRTVPSILMAADAAAKASQVQLVRIKMARELGGKAFFLVTGELAAIEAAIEAAKHTVDSQQTLIDSSIIANPDPLLWESILIGK